MQDRAEAVVASGGRGWVEGVGGSEFDGVNGSDALEESVWALEEDTAAWTEGYGWLLA